MVPAIEKLMDAVGFQSKLNAIAAGFAGVAALLQVGLAFIRRAGARPSLMPPPTIAQLSWSRPLRPTGGVGTHRADVALT
jgi:hypothetical protein